MLLTQCMLFFDDTKQSIKLLKCPAVSEASNCYQPIKQQSVHAGSLRQLQEVSDLSIRIGLYNYTLTKNQGKKVTRSEWYCVIVRREVYTALTDVQSLGEIAYVVVSTVMLFSNDSRARAYQRIKMGQHNFVGQVSDQKVCERSIFYHIWHPIDRSFRTWQCSKSSMNHIYIFSVQ